jgi:Fe-S cluster assembly protein SufD
VTETLNLDSHLAALMQQGSSVPLAAWRDRSVKQFKAFGLPTVRDENWKYTSTRMLEPHRFLTASADKTAISAEDLIEYSVPGLACYRMTFVNGHFSSGLSFLDGLPDGCTLGTISSLQLPEWAVHLLEHSPTERDTGFYQLNGALAQDGLVLHLVAGFKLDRPLQLLCISTKDSDQETEPAVFNLRHLLRLEQGASATVLEHHVAMGASPNLTNVVCQAELAEQASLNHIRLQLLDEQGYLVSRNDLSQMEDSRYHSWSFDLGSRMARHDTNVSLKGERASCDLQGVFALSGKRHVDQHSRVDHIAPNTISNEVFKGVLDGQSRGVFNGKVVVHPGADGTDARQSNANLLLSDKAEIDTKPELEIYADDVKCAHGATVGELDANQLFYLRSRGISEVQARAMLIQAFCREVIDHIEIEPLRAYIEDQFELGLPQWERMEALL